MERFDVIALGCGAGTKGLAPLLAQQGKRVALVERRYIGGSCPNVACLPSKNLLQSAEVAHLAANGGEYGLVQPFAGVDMVRVRQRKRDMVDQLVSIYQRRFDASGLELVMGEGRFVDAHTIAVSTKSGERLLTAETIIIDTGSRARLPDLPGLASAAPMTHVEALDLDVLPEHLIILGGGYVALEFAQAYRRFGSRVTVLERGEELLPREDRDHVAVLRDALEAEGVVFSMATKALSVEGRSGERVTVLVERPAGGRSIEGSHLLVAAGRIPNTDEIGAEIVGLALREDHTIAVDDRLRTNVPGIFALGDCAGSPNFTHIGFDDYLVVADVIAGGERSTAGRQVPFCLFTDPEFARIGLSSGEAKKKGIPVRTLRLPMASVGRAQTLGAERGHLEALIGEDDQIVGFAAVGAGAGELLAPVQVAMAAGLPFTAFRTLILTHPTMSEALKILFLQEPIDGDIRAHA